MGAILKQLVCRGGVPEYLREGNWVFSSRRPRYADLMELSRISIASLPEFSSVSTLPDDCLRNSTHLLPITDSHPHHGFSAVVDSRRACLAE